MKIQHLAPQQRDNLGTSNLITRKAFIRRGVSSIYITPICRLSLTVTPLQNRMISTILLAIILLVVTCWLYSKVCHSYWSSRGVPTAPYSLPFVGHTYRFFKEVRWEFDKELYTKHGGSRYLGVYEMMKPALMVGDPDLLKHIFVKDFDHFVDRRPFGSNMQEGMTGKMLSLLNGDEWKELRAIMTPTFSSGKIKGMFHLVHEKADALVEVSLREGKEKKAVDMKHNFGRFTMDTIASCAFGIECNSLKNHDTTFPKVAEKFFRFTGYKIFKLLLSSMLPWVFNALGFRMDSEETDFFKEVVEETIAARLKGERRGDFLDLLLEARKNSSDPASHEKEVLSNQVILAQSVLFLIAGYDTTASTLAFTAFLLAKNQQHQRRLRKELQEMMKEYGSITYQGIMEAKFLEACLQETLRLCPPAFLAERMCTKDYTFPGTDVKICKGQIVTVPIYSIHRDPQYWPEPEVYRPERFLPENKDDIKSFTHFPFGMGPRNCIAMRFALMEAKVALAKMVLAAEFQLAPGRENLELDTKAFLLRPKDGSVELLLTPLKEE